MIFQVTTFRNEKHQQIEAYADASAVFPVYSKFIGKAMGRFDTPQGKQTIPYDFEIPAATIQEAFEKYADAAKARGQQVQQEIEDSVRRARLSGN